MPFALDGVTFAPPQVMAVSLWTIHTISYASPEVPMEQLAEQVSDVSGIIFFLFGAMTIVEVVDAHQVRVPRLSTAAVCRPSSAVTCWICNRAVVSARSVRRRSA